MTLTPETIRKIARLARLKIQPNEISPLSKDLSHILDWVAQLDEVSCKDVEPMTSVNIQAMPMRHDEVKDGDIANDILQNAPQKQMDMFVVPKVVE